MTQSAQSEPPGHDAQLTAAQIQVLDSLTVALDQATTPFGTSAAKYPITQLPEPALRARSVV